MYQLSYIAVVMQHKKHRNRIHTHPVYTSQFNYQTIPESCQCYGRKTGTYMHDHSFEGNFFSQFTQLISIKAI